MATATAKRTKRDGAQTDAITYEDLYRRWEEGNWKAYDLDFSEDRKGWEALSEIQRKSALWIYSMFFFGEDSVTDNLSPYIDAAPKEEQKYFLATQQVDEARHAVFFHRFFKEVIGAGDIDRLDARLHRAAARLGLPQRLRPPRPDGRGAARSDRSLPKFAQAIALYHMVVEATLAQPGQHFIEDYFTKSGTMPGFSEGMHNVSRDEQRHIGFGVKTLSECFARVRRVQGRGRRDPARGDAATRWRSSSRRAGTSSTRAATASSSRTSSRSACARSRPSGGRPATRIEEMPSGRLSRSTSSMPHEERAQRAITLMRAGRRPASRSPNPDSSPEVAGSSLFDVIARSAHERGASTARR